jgi:hypothetical protein
MEQVLITQWVNENWEMMRYTRHKTLAIERKLRRLRECQAKRAKALAQTKDTKSRNADYPATELGRMDDLQDTIENTANDVDAILDRPTAELDHARALEAGIAYHL